MENSKNGEYEAERNVLRNFFFQICSMERIDNSVSDSKSVRTTKTGLKEALRNVSQRCSCAKRNYGPCELCQASDEELYNLRIFYRQIRNAKKFNLSEDQVADFIKTYKEKLNRK